MSPRIEGALWLLATVLIVMLAVCTSGCNGLAWGGHNSMAFAAMETTSDAEIGYVDTGG